MVDAEGSFDGVPCPECGSGRTVSWHYHDGFDELECRSCGYQSDAATVAELQRASGDVLKRDDEVDAPTPKRPLRA